MLLIYQYSNTKGRKLTRDKSAEINWGCKTGARLVKWFMLDYQTILYSSSYKKDLTKTSGLSRFSYGHYKSCIDCTQSKPTLKLKTVSKIQYRYLPAKDRIEEKISN